MFFFKNIENNLKNDIFKETINAIVEKNHVKYYAKVIHTRFSHLKNNVVKKKSALLLTA